MGKVLPRRNSPTPAIISSIPPNQILIVVVATENPPDPCQFTTRTVSDAMPKSTTKDTPGTPTERNRERDHSNREAKHTDWRGVAKAVAQVARSVFLGGEEEPLVELRSQRDAFGEFIAEFLLRVDVGILRVVPAFGVVVTGHSVGVDLDDASRCDRV